MNKNSKYKNQEKLLYKLNEYFLKFQKTLKTKLNENFLLNNEILRLENHLLEEIENFKEELDKIQQNKCILDLPISKTKDKLYQEIIYERKINYDMICLSIFEENDIENLKIEKEKFKKMIKNKEIDALEEFKDKLSKIVTSIE
ncbi:hypothetical protein PNEG_00992 [Pneumocystis murina B123]|uniref:Uncharacterized protein n=1 Tax=Pneumocystis murina (strain B123) TaxID=1069680 RepID=M7NUS0_PNEMU|nr:hypothetical protein PNEG_00992 [Pneumocystis murina B123]EMR10846.1 hypothetical protein PNEG_00992 [Pneumocystis murina B123]